MRRLRFWKGCVGAVTLVLALGARIVFAQSSGAIAGTVRDTTGAVLPGATVEVSSPALIEKVRAAISDSSGQYRIVDLRPGVYAVTVSLPGFGAYKREGIELSVGFTATVNAELKVGSLQETVTVTGASPVVDVQNSRTQQVLKSETMDVLPTGTKSVMAFTALTLGAVSSTPGRNDVGGDKGENYTDVILHGGRGQDMHYNWDGSNVNVAYGNGGGSARVYYFNTVAVQEVVIDTTASSAETETGGANVNLVPKEGGNGFKVFASGTYSTPGQTAKSIPDEIRARGASPQASFKQIYDFGAGVGGPIRRDRLWFYSSNRWWGAENYASNNYFNKSTNPLFYVPDLDRPAYSSTFYRDNGVRLTWQAAKAHKFAFDLHQEQGCLCWQTIGIALFAPDSANDSYYNPNLLTQPSWTYVATPRLLLQAGASFGRFHPSIINGVAEDYSPFTGKGTPRYPGPDVHPINELIGAPGGAPGGYTYGTLPGGCCSIFGTNNNANSFNERFAVSYVTGSHALKVGFQASQQRYEIKALDTTPGGYTFNMVNYTFRGGVPSALTQFAGPFAVKAHMVGRALYAQDQWTIRKLTMNAGLRFDYFEAHTLAMDLPAGPFVPARSVPRAENLPNFKDLTPRLGVAYDVFGNGKTAVKASFGRYLFSQGSQIVGLVAPSTSIVQSVVRPWADANGNYVPDCVLTDTAANGECGAMSNSAFGRPVTNITIADEARQGWGNREDNYQTSLQLQQELRPGVGVAVGYFRTWWGNQTVIQNTAVTAADFTEFCITAPTDPRLEQFSGQQICGLYDVNPNKFGQVNRVITTAKNFGEQHEIFNGVDFAVNARWGKGALLTGGVTVGRVSADYCYANDHPEITPQGFPGGLYPRDDAYCNPTSPWLDGIGSQVKVQGVYPLPWNLQVSGMYKTLPGVPITANLIVPNAVAAVPLGRNLSGCPAVGACPTNLVVPMVPIGNSGSSLINGSLFDLRLHQTDVRLAKIFRTPYGRFTANMDLYNVFNARPPQGINPTYGPAWKTPALLLGGRLFKVVGQFDF